ncbi:hypothetical protein C8R43DRAFT_358461 [Mycena crocata]|nr:hypothetical protein C8R43DRAFT_358461 [Mycena crocata]
MADEDYFSLSQSPYAHHGHTSPRLQHAQLPVSASASNSPLLRHQGVSTTTPLGSPLLRQSHLPGTPARGATTPNSHSPLARHHQLPATAAATTPDRDELARRHTVPAGTGTVESPRRPGFGAQYASASGYVSAAGSPRRSTFATHSQNSPSPHGVRPRAHTEPTEFADGWEAARDQERVHYERERQMQRERGHGRKSSAYAALAALSGLAGAPSHPGRAGNATTPNANANGYVAHPTYTQTATPGSTPPLSADLVDDDAESDEDDEGSRDRHTRRGGGKLLTPPATPPRHSLVVVAGEDSSSSFDGHPHDLHSHPHAHAQHHDEPRPAFNARKASAQCRQLEGYVSFAAVEGLGEPPSPSPSGASWDEDSEEGAGKRREGRGSIGAGIVGLWRGRGGFWS